jgi:hypothetical protein
MKEQIKYLEQRFCIRTITKRNDQVDKLAKEAAEMDGGQRYIWHTVDLYYMTDKEQVEEKEINKLITMKYKKQYSAKVYDNSGWGGLAQVDKKISNAIFTENSIDYMRLQQNLWRLRNNCLPNHARQYMKYRKCPKDDSITIMRALLNCTPECEETEKCRQNGTIADITHMWTCRSNTQERGKYEVRIEEIMEQIGGTKDDLGQWIPEAADQQELDFGAKDIDKAKANKAETGPAKGKKDYLIA